LFAADDQFQQKLVRYGQLLGVQNVCIVEEGAGIRAPLKDSAPGARLDIQQAETVA
jgi:hypothetical protein